MEERIPPKPENERLLSEVPHPPERPWSGVLKNFSSSLLHLLRAEAHLVRAQLQHNAKTATHKLVEALLFTTLASLGAIALLAAAILVLGKGLNHRYDLSALLIGLLLFILGLFLTIRSLKSIKGAEP